MTARTRTDLLLLAGFCAFLFFYGLGAFGLIGADEPRYAQVAREMLDHRDWVTPVLEGRPWLEKPPLYYWQAMVAYSIFGVSDTVARIPSAFDATLLVIAVYLFFWKFRRGVEIDAALIIASCAGVIGYARAASTDMPLAAAFSIGMLSWWAWRESSHRIYLAMFYVFIALGMLAKGPVAPFLAGLIIVVLAAATRDWRLISKTLWLPGIASFCVVALPWYLLVQLRNPQFFREFILQHNLERFSSNLYHHPEPVWYYIPVIALALVPWIVFVIAAIAAIAQSLHVWWGERASISEDRELQFRFFTFCWLVVPVIFFSFSQSKLPGYILPAVPAGAVLLAAYLFSKFAQESSVSRWLVLAHALVAGAPVVPAILIGYVVTQHRLPPGKPTLYAAGIAFLLCAAIVLTLAGRLRLRMLRFVTLIPVVLAVAAVLKIGSTAIDQKLSARPLAVELASVETHKLPVAVFGASREIEYGLTFYRDQTIYRYESGEIPAGEHLLVAPTNWMDNVAKITSDRRVTWLGRYAPQNLDYFWVSAAGAKR
ncbi:MAG: glycosyltransferase family 39 protein [Candidatus Sulfotelmatobacter sp.]